MRKMKRWIASLGLAAILSAPAYAAPQSAFLKEAIEGDNGEVQLGNLAQEKAQSDAVKSFGSALVTDHTRAKEEASELATGMGMKVPDEASDEAKAEAKKLAAMSGADFDKEFVSYMIDDHKKDIAKYEEEAKKGDGKISDLAEKTLPDLRKHLAAAQQLAAR